MKYNNVEEYYAKKIALEFLAEDIPAPPYNLLSDLVKAKLIDAFAYEKLIKDGEERLQVLTAEIAKKVNHISSLETYLNSKK